jgi:hypothetical protein
MKGAAPRAGARWTTIAPLLVRRSARLCQEKLVKGAAKILFEVGRWANEPEDKESPSASAWVARSDDDRA